MHDVGKIWIGDAYHEIEGADMILKRGEELGLVIGDDEKTKRDFLIRTAACLPPDAALAEEMGIDFPETALYPGYVTPKLRTQVKNLTGKLGNLFVMDTLEKQIASYADWVDIDGDVIDRLDEVIERYRDWSEGASEEKESDYYRKVADVLADNGFRARIIGVCGFIGNLAGY